MIDRALPIYGRMIYGPVQRPIAVGRRAEHIGIGPFVQQFFRTFHVTRIRRIHYRAADRDNVCLQRALHGLRGIRARIKNQT